MTTETTIVPDEEFLEFIRERAASLHRTAYLLCGDWHLADDLVQEALAKAFRHWRRVRRADSPDAYVHRILINEAKNYWRRQGDSERQSVFAEREITSPDMSDDVVNRADLLAALLHLPVRQRATIVLRYLAGMTERETAAALRCSKGTVKSQTFRALNTLKSVLKERNLTDVPDRAGVERGAPQPRRRPAV
jgi:RNA polymerase sigma-70 factor (sigma-E family)